MACAVGILPSVAASWPTWRTSDALLTAAFRHRFRLVQSSRGSLRSDQRLPLQSKLLVVMQVSLTTRDFPRTTGLSGRGTRSTADVQAQLDSQAHSQPEEFLLSAAVVERVRPLSGSRLLPRILRVVESSSSGARWW